MKIYYIYIKKDLKPIRENTKLVYSFVNILN